jgi:glycosyltransferase involved in cell wall biosynthesis
MRVLVISNTPFLPPTAGNRARIGRMLAYLGAHGVEVAMLMLPDVDRHTWDEPGMRAALASFAVAEPPLAARVRRRLLGRRVDAARPLGVDDWCPAWFRRRAAHLARAWRPDVVVAEYVFLSACLAAVRRVAPRALFVIDTHDVMHRRGDVYAAAGLAPRWFHTTRDEERRGLARADVILAMEDGEAALLRELVPDRAVLVVPHAAEVRPVPLAAAAGARLLLVASYNDLNARGLRWLLDEVWPGVRHDVPAAELVVCGTIAEKVRDVPAGVTMRGVVPSLEDEYRRARLVVNPVPATTGIQVKTVEALCHGRPVVATPAGAAGLTEAQGVVVADDAAEFREAVVRLLRDDELCVRRADAAAAHAAERFAPDAAFAPLLACVRAASRA